MNIEEAKKIVKGLVFNDDGTMVSYIDFTSEDYDSWNGYTLKEHAKAVETLLTAYEKEKEENEQWKKYATNDLENQITERNNKIFKLEAELEKEKEKNKKIDEFCRKELAFERRLKRENREPDEFNQGRFYVSENIRKIIEEE